MAIAFRDERPHRSRAFSDDPVGDLIDTERDFRLHECVGFYVQPELAHLSSNRRNDVVPQFEATGFQARTSEELLVGAKLAWRTVRDVWGANIGEHSSSSTPAMR